MSAQHYIDDLRAQLSNLEAGAEGRSFNDHEKERWNSLNAELDQALTRHQRMQELSRTGGVTWVDGEHKPGAATRTTATDESAPEHVRAAHDGALRPSP